MHFAFFSRASAEVRLRILEGRRSRVEEQLQTVRENASRERARLDSWTQALRVRTIVYRACQRIQELSRELAGPAALTGDREFAKADADLTVVDLTLDEARRGADLLRPPAPGTADPSSPVLTD